MPNPKIPILISSLAIVTFFVAIHALSYETVYVIIAAISTIVVIGFSFLSYKLSSKR